MHEIRADSLRGDAIILRFIKLYTLMVIFEGVFRKWIQISHLDFFYFARDLLGFLFCLRLILSHRFTLYTGATVIFYQFAFVAVGFAFFYSVVMLQIPISVAVFGTRNFLSILLVGFILSYLHNFGKLFRAIYSVLVKSLIPQFLIVLFQVSSGPEAFINKTRWNQGASLFTSGETVRPPGTFTNALGLGYYLLICFGFVMAAHLHGNMSLRDSNINAIAFFVILGISALAGSRTVILGLILSVSLYLFIRLRNGRMLENSPMNRKKASRGLIIILVGVVLFSLYKLSDVLYAFLFRIQYQTEGFAGTRSRVIDSIFGYDINGLTWFGTGIGTRHQSALALGWAQTWVENETLRWSAELGILGFLLIVIRQIWIAMLTFKVLFSSRNSQFLAPIIFVSLGPIMFSGLSTQPSVQGVSALLIGIILHRTKIQES